MSKSFTEVNPDKGTETHLKHLHRTSRSTFTEVNPDKGTETSLQLMLILQHRDSLQKLTPIRGRKLCNTSPMIKHIIAFTEVNPDKGTETISS